MIKFVNVNKTFKENIVLQSLTFEVPQGQTWTLLGLSGSGKTTAIKTACGLLTPDSGLVEVAGQKVAEPSLSNTRSKIGYVIQTGGLFPHLSAYDNLALVGREFGWNKEKILSRVLELSQLTRISQTLFAKYPRELSGGERQRVGIIRALLLDPPILLLDEPLGALDPITRSELQDELKFLFKDLRKTVLLVTHDLYEAGYLSHKIALLDQGRVAQYGTFEELVKSPANAFVQKFVRSQSRGFTGE